MSNTRWLSGLLLVQLAWPATARPETAPAENLLASLTPTLATLAREVLERNPGLARARHELAALEARAPQERALPDPSASLALFVLPPETRAGPQQLSVSVMQRLPWLGKLTLRERVAVTEAAIAAANLEARRLDLVTEARRLFYELAFSAELERVVRLQRGAVIRFEEASRARYAAGTGLQQETLRIQAQITRSDERLLDIEERRITLRATLNALRDRPGEASIDGLELPVPSPVDLDREALRELARAHRPELGAAAFEIARQETLVELARLDFKPDFSLGLGYTAVGRRDDAAARGARIDDDGDDILSLSGSVELPVRRQRRRAALEEALARRRGAEEGRREVASRIERAVADLSARLPLLEEHWRLLDKVLAIQAREALRSAESAYATGKLGAVDLLDAEVVLFEVQTAAGRTRADYAVALAELERAIAAPLPGGQRP